MNELEPDVPDPRNGNDTPGNNSTKVKKAVRHRKKRRVRKLNFLSELLNALVTMFSVRWNKMLALVVVLVIDLASKLLVIVAPEQAKDYSVVYGSVSFTLPDGTDVTLPKGSSLQYNAEEFRQGKREVKLVGSAFFAVEKGKSDFVVHSNGLTTRMKEGMIQIKPPATGSKGDIGAETVLIGGQDNVAELLDPAGVDLGTFQGGDEITYRPYTHTIDVQKHDGFLRENDRLVPIMILQNMTFAQAAEKLSEKFNAEILVTEGFQECSVTATFFEQKHTLDDVLEALKGITSQSMECRISRDRTGVIKRVTISGNCDGTGAVDAMPDRAAQRAVQ